MIRSLVIFFLIFISVIGPVCLANDSINPYIPNKINIWIDKEFLKYYQTGNNATNYQTYSTEENEKKLIKELIDLLKLQLKTNLILIKQNKELIELLEKKDVK